MDHRSIYIGNREVGDGLPTFVIAEIGINHCGDMRIAKQLIDAAHSAGVDAVKFQKRELAELYTTRVISNPDAREHALQYIIPVLEKCELSPTQILELRDYAVARGLFFLCTPFDITSASFLESIGIVAFKISSSDLLNFPLLDAVMGAGKPLILSTGMHTLEEVALSVRHLRQQHARFVLLHCVSSYPVNPRYANLPRIQELSQRFDVVAGYSGHDLGIALSLVARALGAAVIEKHITFDRGASGPDHRFSLLPEELTALVASIRDVDEGLKTGREGEILQGEQLNRFVFKKSVVAKKAIKAGDIIERDALAIRGPGIGLSPHRLNELIGRRAIRDVGNDEMLFDEDLGAPRESYRMSMPCPGWGLVVRYHDFETALPHGPECLEFHLTTADMEMELPFAKLDAYAADLRALVLRVHSPEYIGNRLFDLFSIYPEVYSASLATLQRVIDVTSELGSYFNGESPMIVFNCGAMTLQGEARALPLDVGRFYAGIASLNLKGTRLLAQNMPPFPWYFGGQWHGHYFLRASELMEFCEQTGGGICLDISHAYMATRFLKVPLKKYIQELLPYVHHIHVSDARSLSGEGVQIGEGEVDFKEIGPLIFERPLRRLATWVPEIWQGHVNCNSGALAAIAALGKLGIWG